MSDREPPPGTIVRHIPAEKWGVYDFPERWTVGHWDHDIVDAWHVFGEGETRESAIEVAWKNHVALEAYERRKKESTMAPKKKQKTEKTEKIVRTLRCDLTEKEVKERADRAAHLVSERDQRESEMKNAAQHMRAQVKELDSELRKVSTEVRDRSCMRAVECEVRYDYRTGRVITKRLDTKELIEERPMQDYERQRELELGEEQNEAEEAFAEQDPKPAKKRTRKPRADAGAEA